MKYCNIIGKAIKSLYDKADKSTLRDNEKNVIKMLITKLVEYYTKEYNKICEYKHEWNANNKYLLLASRMVDYIVLVNDTIDKKYDVHYVVNSIYKEINYDTKTKHFKRKRLI